MKIYTGRCSDTTHVVINAPTLGADKGLVVIVQEPQRTQDFRRQMYEIMLDGRVWVKIIGCLFPSPAFMHVSPPLEGQYLNPQPGLIHLQVDIGGSDENKG